jgi:hypothetical protein
VIFKHTPWHSYCFYQICYCVAFLIEWKMRDGIFSFYVRSDETAIRAIALVEKDSIKGFNRSHIYSVDRLVYSSERLRKDRNTNWRIKVVEHNHVQGFSIRGFPAKNSGSKEVPRQTGASGSKSKELGFKICRGIVGLDPRSPRPEFSEGKAVKRRRLQTSHRLEETRGQSPIAR